MKTAIAPTVRRLLLKEVIMDKQKLEDELEDLEILLPKLRVELAEVLIAPQDDEEYQEADIEMITAEINHTERRIAIIKKRLTQRPPDAGDSAASTSIIHASVESASEGNA